MTVEPSGGRNLAAETGGALFGSLIGLTVGASAAVTGAPASVAAAIGGTAGASLTPVLERFVARAADEHRRQGQVLADAASRMSGLSAEEVVQRVLDADDLQPLVRRVFEAASRANSEQVLRMLGYILGEAVTARPRTVDEDLMLVEGFTDLTPGHLRVLEALEPLRPTQNGNTGSKRVWGTEQLAGVLGDSISPVALKAALGGVVARGLVEVPPMTFFGPNSYRLTDFGRAVLTAARLSTPQ